jgi:PAS domain S-box-containing protein
VIIAELLYNSRALYRGQAGALLGATTLPVLLNAIHIFDIFGEIPFDTTPIGFILSGTLYAIAIVRYRLVDIVPIARDRVLDTVSDAVFVIDTHDRLIDINPVGREMLEEIDDSPIGASLDSLLEEIPELRDEYRELTARPVETERELALFGGHYHVRATPIEDGRDHHAGWLLVVRDITERKQREAQLRRQNERLEQFADLVSHDLRNPLNVATGYLDLAREAEDDEEHLDRIEQSHERMDTIIEDVLTLAREGAEVTDPEPVPLAAIAERAWNGVATGSATIVIDADVTILADPDRTTRVLENLFRNSLEHGTERDAGADIEITVGTFADAPDGSVVGFYVADDGVGIPTSERDQVFEGGYTTNADGTGFGLSIVNEIATAHGWTTAVTESETGGARFEFRGVERAAETAPPNDGPEPDLEAESSRS